MAQRSESKSIPDLYKLLGLSGPAASEEQVSEAIGKLERKAVALSQRDDSRAAGAKQLLRVARKQLTSPQQRELYDQAWSKQFGAASADTRKAPASNAVAQPTSTRLRELLPAGSPEAPFDMATYLSQQQEPVSDAEIEQEFATIIARMSGIHQPAASSTPQPAAPHSPVAAASALQPVSRPAPGISNKLRRKKKGNLLVPAIGLVSCTAAVLALIAYLVNSPGDEKEVADATQQKTAPATTAPAPSQPKRSGLPQVKGLDGSNSNTESLGGNFQLGGVNDSMQGAAKDGGMAAQMSGTSGGSDLAAASNMSADDDGMTPMNSGDSMPEMQSPTMQPGGASPPNDSTPPSTTSPEPLTAEAKQLFVSVCQEAIQLLGDYEYDDARNKLDQLLELNLPPEEKGQASRLRQLADYAEQGFRGLEQAIRNLGPGEVFTVGTSTQVSFVEAADKRITLKLGPRPKTYDYAVLPPGVLYSLFDLALDRRNQTALAQRSAFILFQPNRNARSLATAQDYMTRAIVSSNVPGELVDVFGDPWFSE